MEDSGASADTDGVLVIAGFVESGEGVDWALRLPRERVAKSREEM
jgi:hypothetical protein